MNTYAWDHNLPCQNPNCKSHGKPHPNCRCYGGMAEGGEAEPFCARDRAHDPDCEYFAGGGEVPASDLPEESNVVPQDDLPEMVTAGGEVPADDLPEEMNSKPGDQFAAGMHGFAKGVVGPLANYAATHEPNAMALQEQMGMPQEEIPGAREKVEGLAKQFPGTHAAGEGLGFASSLLMGTGEAGAISHAAGAIPEISAIGKLGSAALRSMVEGVSFSGADEITKALLHQPGSDPETPVATALLHMGANGIINTVTGGLFNIVGKGLGEIGGKKMTDAAEKALAKLAEGKPVTKALEIGASLYAGSHATNLMKEVIESGGTYSVLRGVLEPYLEKIIGKPLTKANQYVSDALTSALLKENTLSIPTVMKWGSTLGKGAQKLLPALESVFKTGSKTAVPWATKELMDELHKNVEDGTPQEEIKDTLQDSSQPQAFAKGGQVIHCHPQGTDHFGSIFPTQNVLLNTAKGRIYTYLNSIRPQANQPKLPFDDPPSDALKEKSYRRALALAVNPLQILNHVQAGDLTPEDMAHFTHLYPEVHKLLSKKMTEKITEAQLKGEKPPYGKRQAMSLFLGSALDGSLTPQSLQAAQNVFAMKQAAKQQAPAPKKKKASLSKNANSYLTDDQARETRQQKV